MVLRHYRFNISFNLAQGSPYIIYDTYGYFEYNTETKVITKMCNGAIKHNGDVIQQLYPAGKELYGYTSDNLLGSTSTSDVFTTTPLNSSNPNNYVPITQQPASFRFGLLILANSFITIYNNDNVGINIAQYWELLSSSNNQIDLYFVKGVSDTWTKIDDSIATYNITFTEVGSDNPTAKPACFIEGSKIFARLNNNDAYIPIQNLKKGDLVKTYLHGYRKIIMIGKNTLKNDPTKWNYCIKRLRKNKLGAIDDLMLTGGHSILVNNLSEKEKAGQISIYNSADRKIDGKYLLLASVSENFETVNDNNKYTYYHLVLEHDGDLNVRYGIWANGVLTESQSENHFLSKGYIQ